MQVNNDPGDNLDLYDFYYHLGLGSIDSAAPAEQQEEEKAKKVNLLAQQARYQDTIASAQREVAIKSDDVQQESFWDWMTRKSEETWNQITNWFEGKAGKTAEVPVPGVSGDAGSPVPELEQPKELTPDQKLRQEIRQALQNLEQLNQAEDTSFNADLAFSEWLRAMSEQEKLKSQDLLEDYKHEKKKNEDKRKKYFEICDEWVSLEEKRKIAEWVEWGVSIGGMVVGGTLSLLTLGLDGGAFIEIFKAAGEGAVAAIQGTTQATSAYFKHLIRQNRANMIEIKEKMRDQEDKVAKVIKDFGESNRRVSNYFKELVKCKENWRRTVLTFFRR